MILDDSFKKYNVYNFLVSSGCSIALRLWKFVVQEPCHKLAWTLDACYRDQVLDERRLKELTSIIQSLQNFEKKGISVKRGRDWESQQISMGNRSHSEQNPRVLAEAGMIIRDPSIFHLIIHQVKFKLFGPAL